LGFLEIFSDPDYPRLGFTLQVDPPGTGDTTGVWIHGEQVDIEAAAALIQATARSALPSASNMPSIAIACVRVSSAAASS
jgi:hypothetical protein